MQRLRTIHEAYEEIKAQDKNTSLTKYALQTLVKSNIIPSVSIGRKHLLNMEVLEQYLQGNMTTPPQTKKTNSGVVRKVGL